MEKELWNLLKDNGTLLQVPKGTQLTGPNSVYSADTLFFLADGIVALSGITKNGEEIVYLYFHAPRIMGFNRHFNDSSGRIFSDPEFSNITKTDCCLYQIPIATFLRLLENNAALNMFFIKTIASNYSEALAHFHFMQEESVIVRLCHLLLEVSQPLKGRMVVPKFYSHAELARYLGCHPVTVSRIMPRLKAAGYIRKEPEGVIIENPEGLIHIIETESKFTY